MCHIYWPLSVRPWHLRMGQERISVLLSISLRVTHEEKYHITRGANLLSLLLPCLLEILFEKNVIYTHRSDSITLQNMLPSHQLEWIIPTVLPMAAVLPTTPRGKEYTKTSMSWLKIQIDSRMEDTVKLLIFSSNSILAKCPRTGTHHQTNKQPNKQSKNKQTKMNQKYQSKLYLHKTVVAEKYHTGSPFPFCTILEW